MSSSEGADNELGSAEAFASAVRSAQDAKRAWAAMPAPERGRLLTRVARVAEDEVEGLAQSITAEIGKPIRQARFEANEFASMFGYYGAGALRPDGVTVSSDRVGTQLMVFRAPLGVCAVITPLNYPVAHPAWALAPALAAGNTVVWKPDAESAFTARAIMDLLRRGGIPDGVVNLVLTDPQQTETGLADALRQKALDQVAFVGRTENGVAINALCAPSLMAPSLQLAGNNPLVLAADGDLHGAVEAVRFSSFGVNQGCTAIRVALVPQDRHDEFVRELDAVISAAPIGDPSEEVVYGPMFSERYSTLFDQALESISDHHRTSGSTGIGRITESNPREGFVGDPSRGSYYHPTIVDGVRPDDTLFTRETLGPLVSVVTYDTFDEAVELANAVSSGFLASVFTNAPATAFAFRERVSAGTIAVNRPTSLAGEQRTPMGGNGDAGNNTRLAGPWAIDNFTRWQTMSWEYGEQA